MNKSALLSAVVFCAACSPNVPKSSGGPDGGSNYITVQFDPGASVPVVPTPNDLAFQGSTTGKLNLPVSGSGLSPAQIEFNQFLNTLDGFPLDASASTSTSEPVDDAALTAATVPVFDLGPAPTPGAPLAVTSVVPVSGLTRRYNADSHAIEVRAPANGWTRGHLYAVVVYGGESGVKGGEKQVAASPAWALLRSTAPLVSCTSATSCTATTDVIPSDELDPAKRAADQATKAKQLEALRQLYKPLIDAASAGKNREDVALAWTFRAQTRSQLTFDPGSGIIPFPNDLLRTGDGGTVSLPENAGLPAALVAGLNTLDGFSTTGTIVSENGAASPAVLGGALDAGVTALDPASPTSPIHFMKLASRGAAGPAPQVAVCLTASCGISPTLLDGGTKPELFGLVPKIPLNEKTTYGVFILGGETGLTDAESHPMTPSPAFVLLRSTSPLYDAATKKSLVSALTDAQAAQLEQARVAHKPFFDALESLGAPRSALLLAWTFTTQTTISALAALHAAPAQLPTTPIVAANITSQLSSLGAETAVVVAGEMSDLSALNATTGTFAPGLAGAQVKKIGFTMAVPSSSPPTGGYPITIFGHGLTFTRDHILKIAPALNAAGQLVIAIDEPWHGDRNTCLGFGAYLNAATSTSAFTDDFACADPTTQQCNATTGRCQKKEPRADLLACDAAAAAGDLPCLQAGLGRCSPDNRCEAGAFGTEIPLPGAAIPVSGWKLINLQNLFATRDNFRQQVISQAQLERVLATASLSYTEMDGGSTAVAVDKDQIHYVGQSLGGVLGTLNNAVSPEVKNVALNVPGAGLIDILFTSKGFEKQKDAFVAGLQAQGIEPQSPQFDTLLGVAKWILDPADPANAAYYLTHSAAPIPNLPDSGRHAFIQWIVGDEVVPNGSTVTLVKAALADSTATGDTTAADPFFVSRFDPASDIPTCERHNFLLVPPFSECKGTTPATGAAQLTTDAQSQVGQFITTGSPF